MGPGIGGTVPPWSVQKVGEKAIKDVGGRRQEGVSIEVRASRVEGSVVVLVSDNGPGFSEDSLTAGHGLDNLQARLRALYGDRAGLEFLRASRPLIVRLPVPAA